MQTASNVHIWLPPVPGIRLGVTAVGIKHPERRERSDLALIELAPGGHAAAVFTRNAFCAAPVILARRHLAMDTSRYLLINSGNANAGTGEQGLADSIACCTAVAELTQCRPQQVLPFSTGVIGEPLPVARLIAGLSNLVCSLQEDGWIHAAQAIMTTDTVPKFSSRRVNLAGGHTATVVGIAKGAGMICPDMATMLAYVATDLAVIPLVLQQILEAAVELSFNAITVDGDSSTNDACVLLASGVNPAPLIETADSPAGNALAQAVAAVCLELAMAIVRDGEGATKFITVEVTGAKDRTEARQVAYTIAHSPLVKTALFASDPNWGRILAAVGRAGIANLNIAQVHLYLNDLCIVRNGGRDPNYTDQAGREIFTRQEFTIRVDLQRGVTTVRIFTCDLSYDYVRINAEYRT